MRSAFEQKKKNKKKQRKNKGLFRKITINAKLLHDLVQ